MRLAEARLSASIMMKLLHDPLVDRRGVARDDEGIAAADGLLVAHVDLAVGEVVGTRSARARCRAP